MMVILLTRSFKRVECYTDTLEFVWGDYCLIIATIESFLSVFVGLSFFYLFFFHDLAPSICTFLINEVA